MSSLNKRARRALVGLVTVTALGLSAAVLPQLAVASFDTVSATTALNVRAQPSTSSSILGVLSTGEQVERRGDPRGEWTPIRYRGQDAWVFSAYTTLGSLTSAAGGTGTATSALNVRAQASTLSQILGVLRVGEQVSITGSAVGGWVPVNYGGRNGFVYGAYLSLDSSSGASPLADTSSNSGSASATTYVNVRSGPSTNDRILGVLPTGGTVAVRGPAQGDWTPVSYNGQDAWIFSRYLSTGSGQSSAYTTTGVNLRTGPGLGYGIVRVLGTNTQVELTGQTQEGWSQVRDGDQLRWISTQYLSASPVSGQSNDGAVQGPVSNGGSTGGSLNTGGSSGLDGLRDTTKQVVYSIRQNFPQITTMYGVRADPIPDHPSGRAVDIMMPQGADDVALGDAIAAHLQSNADALNIEYLIWRQRIWINGQSGWTWMADRGSTTANHYDHVHVTVRY